MLLVKQESRKALLGMLENDQLGETPPERPGSIGPGGRRGKAPGSTEELLPHVPPHQTARPTPQEGLGSPASTRERATPCEKLGAQGAARESHLPTPAAGTAGGGGRATARLGDSAAGSGARCPRDFLFRRATRCTMNAAERTILRQGAP